MTASTDRTCSTCHAKSGHHRRDCPARGKRSGPKAKDKSELYVTIPIPFPPEMAQWLRRRRDSGESSIANTVREGVRLVRGW